MLNIHISNPFSQTIALFDVNCAIFLFLRKYPLPMKDPSPSNSFHLNEFQFMQTGLLLIPLTWTNQRSSWEYDVTNFRAAIYALLALLKKLSAWKKYERQNYTSILDILAKSKFSLRHNK